MKKYFEILRKSPLFDSISDEELPELLKCINAKAETFDKKYTVLAEGGPAGKIGIVLSGEVQMIKTDYYGNRSIIAEIHPADVFGESFACAEISELPVSVIASEKSEVLLIDSLRILHSCSNACSFHQQMIFNLMKILAYKNISFYEKIDVTSKRSTREKLMTYLMLEAKKAKSNSFSIPFDRQELADYLEVERSGLSSEIGKMKKDGIIDCEKNNFIIL